MDREDSKELKLGERVVFDAGFTHLRGTIDSLEGEWVFWTEDSGALHYTHSSYMRRDR